MREQIAAARNLPLQRRPQMLGIDGDQQQAGRAGEMLGRGGGELGSGGEVDETVARVGGRSPEDLVDLGLTPQSPIADLVDRVHRRAPPCAYDPGRWKRTFPKIMRHLFRATLSAANRSFKAAPSGRGRRRLTPGGLSPQE